jgi:hypothetical protein
VLLPSNIMRQIVFGTVAVGFHRSVLSVRGVRKAAKDEPGSWPRVSCPTQLYGPAIFEGYKRAVISVADQISLGLSCGFSL